MANHLSLHPSCPGIYQIINNTTQKRYIGYASNIRTRVNGHLHDLNYNKHPNDYLQKAWLKYGRAGFSFEVLQKCEYKDLCLCEDYWVKILKVNDPEYGYNLKPTDPNGKPGQSEATIEKIRAKNKGRKPSVLCMQRRREVQTSPEGKQRQKESLKKVDWYKVRASKKKPVWDRDKGLIYDSLNEAAKSLGMTKHKLSKYLLGTRTNKTSLSYI